MVDQFVYMFCIFVFFFVIIFLFIFFFVKLINCDSVKYEMSFGNDQGIQIDIELTLSSAKVTTAF